MYGPPVHINDLNCTGNEESVFDCPHNSLATCSQYSVDAAIICQGIG